MWQGRTIKENMAIMKKPLGILVLGSLVFVSRVNANLIKLENCFTKDYFYNGKTESQFKFKEVPSIIYSDEYHQRLKDQNRIIINDPYVSESTIEFFKKSSVEKVWCSNEGAFCCPAL